VAWSYLRKSQASFSHANAAIMAPRSRRDKDMSDNKAIKQKIKVIRQRNSPSHPAKTVTVTFFGRRSRVKCRIPPPEKP
jgi:hypothetical protein